MVTIQDIANKSGVAMSTVSRALADSPKISVKTKERIKKWHKIWAIRQILLHGI